MADVVGVGFEAGALDALRTSIANSATFRTWTSTASVALAKVRAYRISLPVGSTTLPCALVDVGDAQHEAIALGTSMSTGTLNVVFMMAASDSHNDGDAAYTLLNAAGEIVREMAEKVGTAACLNIGAVRRTSRPERASEDEETELGEDFYRIDYEVDFMGA